MNSGDYTPKDPSRPWLVGVAIFLSTLLSADSGRTVWSQAWKAPLRDFMDTEFGPGPHSTPPITPNNLLFFDSSEGGKVLRLERQDGSTQPRELWSLTRSSS